jgi:hypothetical protein
MSNAVLIDPHGLLLSGEELATEGELARILGISRAALHPVFQAARAQIRHVHHKPGPCRYSVSDARKAIGPHLPELEARTHLAAARQASEVAAAEARRAAKAAEHEAHVTSREPPASSRGVRSDAPRPKSGGPEVIVRRRLGAA